MNQDLERGGVHLRPTPDTSAPTARGPIYSAGRMVAMKKCAICKHGGALSSVPQHCADGVELLAQWYFHRPCVQDALTDPKGYTHLEVDAAIIIAESTALSAVPQKQREKRLETAREA